MQAWLTPDIADLSAPDASRLITIPNELWPYVSGAFYLLTLDSNWEEFGTATPSEIASLFREKLLSFVDYAPEESMQVQFFQPPQLLVSASSSGGVTAWDIDTASLPEGAKILYADAYVSCTSGGIFSIEARNGITGFQGLARHTFAPSGEGFQIVAPVGSLGIRVSISGGGTWSIYSTFGAIAK